MVINYEDVYAVWMEKLLSDRRAFHVPNFSKGRSPSRQYAVRFISTGLTSVQDVVTCEMNFVSGGINSACNMRRINVKR